MCKIIFAGLITDVLFILLPPLPLCTTFRYTHSDSFSATMTLSRTYYIETTYAYLKITCVYENYIRLHEKFSCAYVFFFFNTKAGT